MENNVHKSHYLRQHQKIVANLLVGDVATAIAASYSLMKKLSISSQLVYSL